jgi:hypothetical protein
VLCHSSYFIKGHINIRKYVVIRTLQKMHLTFTCFLKDLKLCSSNVGFTDAGTPDTHT